MEKALTHYIFGHEDTFGTFSMAAVAETDIAAFIKLICVIGSDQTETENAPFEDKAALHLFIFS